MNNEFKLTISNTGFLCLKSTPMLWSKRWKVGQTFRYSVPWPFYMQSIGSPITSDWIPIVYFADPPSPQLPSTYGTANLAIPDAPNRPTARMTLFWHHLTPWVTPHSRNAIFHKFATHRNIWPWTISPNAVEISTAQVYDSTSREEVPGACGTRVWWFSCVAFPFLVYFYMLNINTTIIKKKLPIFLFKNKTLVRVFANSCWFHETKTLLWD